MTDEDDPEPPEEEEEVPAEPEEPKPKDDVVVGPSHGPATSDIKGRRELAASLLAGGALLLLSAVLLIPIIAAACGAEGADEASEIAKTVAPAITALLGIAFGFYFSEKRHDS